MGTSLGDLNQKLAEGDSIISALLPSLPTREVRGVFSNQISLRSESEGLWIGAGIYTSKAVDLAIPLGFGDLSACSGLFIIDAKENQHYAAHVSPAVSEANLSSILAGLLGNRLTEVTFAIIPPSIDNLRVSKETINTMLAALGQLAGDCLNRTTIISTGIPAGDNQAISCCGDFFIPDSDTRLSNQVRMSRNGFGWL